MKHLYVVVYCGYETLTQRFLEEQFINFSLSKNIN